MDLIERDLNERRDDIGHQHLLGEADDEDARADGGAAEREPARVQLARDGLVANDRSRDQLREEGNVERDVDRIAIGPESPPVDVDDVGQAVEGEEGDPERKWILVVDDRQSERRQQAPARLAVTKLAYLKIPRTQQISGDRDRQARPGGPIPPARRWPGPHKKLKAIEMQKDDDELGLSPGVEHQGEQKRDDILGLGSSG